MIPNHPESPAHRRGFFAALSPLQGFSPAAGRAAVLSPGENLWDKQKPGLLLETGWFAVYFTTVPG